jgi:hypothetical protein
MSAGEKIAEKAWEAMERDMQSGPVIRRALWHGFAGAAIVTVFLAIMIGSCARKTGLVDAFEGGAMAKQKLPVLMENIADIRMDVQRIAGAVDVLTGRGMVVMTTTQDAPRPLTDADAKKQDRAN